MSNLLCSWRQSVSHSLLMYLHVGAINVDRWRKTIRHTLRLRCLKSQDTEVFAVDADACYMLDHKWRF